MSEEQLKAFIAKVQSDPSLQERLKAEGADPVAIANAAGFAITQAEVNAFQIRAAVSGAQSGEGFLLRTSSAAHTWILDAEL